MVQKQFPIPIAFDTSGVAGDYQVTISEPAQDHLLDFFEATAEFISVIGSQCSSAKMRDSLCHISQKT